MGHDPVRLLGSVPTDRLHELAADKKFLRMLELAHADLEQYLTRDRWYQSSAGDTAPVHRLLLPGVRHHRGAAAVLRRSRHPRRRPSQDRLRPRRPDRGRRPAVPARLLPAVPVARGLAGGAHRSSTRTASRSPCSARRTKFPGQISISLPGDESLTARIWIAQVGRVPLLLLDSDVEENSEVVRDVTDRQHGGTTEHRLRQELLLGVGGVQALRAFSRITGARTPRSSTPTRATPASSASSGSAS